MEGRHQNPAIKEIQMDQTIQPGIDAIQRFGSIARRAGLEAVFDARADLGYVPRQATGGDRAAQVLRGDPAR